jgi:maltose/moltooligosaccharide transporter
MGASVPSATCLVIGGPNLASIVMLTQELLIIPMIGVGIAWASILTMPSK